MLSCINDNETSVQAMSLEAVKCNIFDNIISWYVNLVKTMGKEIQQNTNLAIYDQYIHQNLEAMEGFKAWLILEQYLPNYEVSFYVY